MEYKTFEDWSRAGYKIIVGSKSTRRDDLGRCLFGSDQVRVRDVVHNGRRFRDNSSRWHLTERDLDYGDNYAADCDILAHGGDPWGQDR